MSGDAEPSDAAARRAAVLRSVSPLLPVADVPAAIRLCCDVPGFRVDRPWGDPPTVGSVCRDATEPMLEQRYDGVPPGAARVAVPLAARDYGMRDCRLVDPDGNELSFGSSTG